MWRGLTWKNVIAIIAGLLIAGLVAVGWGLSGVQGSDVSGAIVVTAQSQY